MATAFLGTPAFRAQPAHLYLNSFKFPKLICTSFRRRHSIHVQSRLYCSASLSHRLSRRSLNHLPFASYDETTETETKTQGTEDALESEIVENSDGAVGVEEGVGAGDNGVAEEPTSAIFGLLKSYRKAIAGNDESTIAEIEGFLTSIEDKKIDLEEKVVALSEELSYEKDRILRISADFDNFRKRTERERLSLVTNAQGEVVENLLPVLDNFERAKAQIKAETEGEEKINNSYQSIYKQFVESLKSLGVIPVETVGKPFDPLLHEAIMRGDSTEFEEDVIIEEYRKGFKLGDRLLRPSMVKVSAGPGPAKPELKKSPEAENVGETSHDCSTEAGSPE